MDTPQDKSNLWAAIFQETDLVSKLMNSKWNTANFEFDLKQFGETKLSVRKAVPLGTNFLSDVFNVTVIVNNNQSYEAFVKVIWHIFTVGGM